MSWPNQNQKIDKHTNQVTKPKWTNLLWSSGFSSSLSVLLLVQLWALLTSQWGPSCWSPSPKPVTPPLVGCTATTHSNRSDRQDQEARECRRHREHREVPSLRHGRLCRKLVGPDHLREEASENSNKNRRQRQQAVWVWPLPTETWSQHQILIWFRFFTVKYAAKICFGLEFKPVQQRPTNTGQHVLRTFYIFTYQRSLVEKLCKADSVNKWFLYRHLCLLILWNIHSKDGFI